MSQHPDSPEPPAVDRAAQTTAATAAPPGSGPPADDPELTRALAAAAQRPTSTSRLTLGLAGALLLIGGFGGGYAVGHHAGADGQPANRVTFPGGFSNGGPDGSQPGPGGGQRPGLGDFTAGTVTKVDGDTVTVKTPDGDDVTVATDSDTDVTVTKEGSVSDLSAGDPVVVTGSRRDDGSIDADSISEGDSRLAVSPGDGT
jgi:hypothetical protein